MFMGFWFYLSNMEKMILIDKDPDQYNKAFYLEGSLFRCREENHGIEGGADITLDRFLGQM